MSTETLFTICNYSVMPAWLLLALAPRSRATAALVHAAWIPLILSAVYIAMLVMGEAGDDANFFSLAGVMAFFRVPEAVLAGWVHYLAFDLFVGAWEVRDAGRRGIPHWMVVPCLFFTLMFGPVGLTMYIVLRAVLRQTMTFSENP